jgi:hypothetical protein
MSAHCHPLALPRFLHLIAQHCLSHYMSAHPPTLPRFLCVNTAMYRLHHYPHLSGHCCHSYLMSLSVIRRLSLASYATAPINAHCHRSFFSCPSLLTHQRPSLSLPCLLTVTVILRHPLASYTSMSVIDRHLITSPHISIRQCHSHRMSAYYFD